MSADLSPGDLVVLQYRFDGHPREVFGLHVKTWPGDTFLPPSYDVFHNGVVKHFQGNLWRLIAVEEEG